MFAHADIESFSEIDLTEVGVYAYAEHPSTRIYCLSYIREDGVKGTWIAGEPKPADLDEVTNWRAWNAQFERVMLNSHAGRTFGFPATSIEQWTCTMVLSAYNGLPKQLGQCAQAIGLKDGKDKEGAKIMRLLCQPKRPTKKDPTTEWEPHGAHREMFEKLYAYCAQDVEVERNIHKRLPRLPEIEQKLFWLDQEINDRGIRVDMPLVNRVCDLIELKAADFQERAVAICGHSTTKREEILKWCASQGVFLDGYTKDDVASALKTKSLPPDVREVLEIRRDASRQSSGSKFFAAKRSVGGDERIRGTLRFFGAVPTGRWAGDLIQPQNFSNKGYPQSAPADVTNFDIPDIEMLYGDAMPLFGNMSRAMLVPKKGCRFIGCDEAAVEGRIAAWFAEEKWALDVYRTHGKVYEATAAQMFGLPFTDFLHHYGYTDDELAAPEWWKRDPANMKKHHPLRPKGKVSSLACGFGGSVGALVRMGALREGLTEDDLPALVKQWREANPNIVKAWWAMDRAAISAVEKPGQVFSAVKCAFKSDGNWLMLKIPSGRVLRYWKPRIEEVDKGWGLKPQLTYFGERQLEGSSKRVWCKVDTYGPKVFQNAVQSLARDVLREALFRLHDAGYKTVFHVHDEIVVEAPFDFGSVKEVEQLMSAPMPWAPDLPLAAAGEEQMRYAK